MAGAVSAAYAIRFTASVVVGAVPDALRSRVSKVPVLMRLPITLLAAACLAVGIRRALSTGQVNNLAVCAVLGQAGPGLPYDIAIWHGVNPALMLSLVPWTGAR